MTASWVLVRLADNKAIAETYLRHVAAAINTEKYKAVPVGEYLADLNRRIKNGESV
jgi:hypothetical protein